MSVAKVIEISAQSPESFDDAVKVGVRRAAHTVDNIQSAWVKEFQAEVEGDRVVAYRVNMKVTFLLKE